MGLDAYIQHICSQTTPAPVAFTYNAKVIHFLAWE